MCLPWSPPSYFSASIMKGNFITSKVYHKQWLVSQGRWQRLLSQWESFNKFSWGSGILKTLKFFFFFFLTEWGSHVRQGGFKLILFSWGWPWGADLLLDFWDYLTAPHTELVFYAVLELKPWAFTAKALFEVSCIASLFLHLFCALNIGIEINEARIYV